MSMSLVINVSTETNRIAKAELMDAASAQVAADGKLPTSTTYIVSVAAIRDLNGAKVELEVFLNNFESFIYNAGSIQQAVGTTLNNRVIDELNMETPMSFTRANTVAEIGRL